MHTTPYWRGRAFAVVLGGSRGVIIEFAEFVSVELVARSGGVKTRETDVTNDLGHTLFLVVWPRGGLRHVAAGPSQPLRPSPR